MFVAKPFSIVRSVTLSTSVCAVAALSSAIFAVSADARKIENVALGLILDTETQDLYSLNELLDTFENNTYDVNAYDLAEAQMVAGPIDAQNVITQISQSIAASDYKDADYGAKFARAQASTASGMKLHHLASAFEELAAKYDTAAEDPDLTRAGLNSLMLEQRQIVCRVNAHVARISAKDATWREGQEEIVLGFSNLAEKYDTAAGNPIPQDYLDILETEGGYLTCRSMGMITHGKAQYARNVERHHLADALEQLAANWDTARDEFYSDSCPSSYVKKTLAILNEGYGRICGR
jgi:hypothetical protein